MIKYYIVLYHITLCYTILGIIKTCGEDEQKEDRKTDRQIEAQTRKHTNK